MKSLLKLRVLIYLASGLLFGCNKAEKASSKSSVNENAQKAVKHQKSNNSDNANFSKRTLSRDNPETKEALQKFASDFENLGEQNLDQDTLAKQRDLALAVLPKIGGSDELLKFLDFLTERGVGDLRKELIEKHLGAIFTGPGAENAREWLLSVQDEKLRERLSQAAGEAFSGIGFKEYFEKMGEYGDHHSQAALLKGYCMTLAKSDPEAAVKAYQDLGYPKRIDNTGLADVYAAMPPDTDFLKFATGIKEDSLTLAKRSRAALLRNWAGTKPQDAAQYVLANGKSGVAADQMAEVVLVWAKTSPDESANWLAKAPTGEMKDEGNAALAKFWSESDPLKAWERASMVGDFNKRVETATAVFTEWEKLDKAAATKAWITLFPPEQ